MLQSLLHIVYLMHLLLLNYLCFIIYCVVLSCSSYPLLSCMNLRPHMLLLNILMLGSTPIAVWWFYISLFTESGIWKKLTKVHGNDICCRPLLLWRKEHICLNMGEEGNPSFVHSDLQMWVVLIVIMSYSILWTYILVFYYVYLLKQCNMLSFTRCLDLVINPLC